MTFISTALPEKIRSMLEHNLLASMEDLDVVQEKDTEQRSDEDKRFRALHLSWYNRHCTKVSKNCVFAGTRASSFSIGA
jgi:propanediol dehydratase large subunit